ncbi:MAG: hypothetical protein CSA19_00195 [Deltaproteobacteria bacterium]|nr:MAG: hypothetical protein CSA19_00195 [Deltaproteobacteria bacterium]
MNKNFLFFLFILSFLAGNAFCAESTEEKNKSENKEQKVLLESAASTYRLDPIVVTEEKEGKIVLEKSTLELLPNPMGNVTDTLRGKSSIQFDSLSLDAFTGGAITPPKISIRGAHHYENNFMINGMSNNSPLDPSGFDEKDAYPGIPPSGDSQAMFISADLLDSVITHTENISAAYGDFLGGVVDARYRNAAADRWHISLSTRHTRDTWANQHYITGNEPDDYPRSKSGQHTRFKKSSFSTIVEGPVFNSLGLLLAYDRKWSEIPVYVMQPEPEERTDTRVNENYLIRLNSQLSDHFIAGLTATYAPYRAKRHPIQKDGKLEIKGGGFGLNLETQWSLPVLTWENNLAFQSTEVSKYANSSSMYQWLSKPGGKPSSYATWADPGIGKGKKAFEGLMGDWKNRQTVYELKSHIRFKELGSKQFRHNLLTGLDLKFLKARAKASGYTSYFGPEANEEVTGDLADGVISGEQYATSKKVAPAQARSQDYKTAAFFAEDRIEIERVTLRPGLRASWDSITKDFNLAPRFFVNVDLQNNDRFNIFGGYNRYYGSQILHHALKIPLLNTTYKRTIQDRQLQNWQQDKTSTRPPNWLGNLKTPYTDEFTAGASANILDTLFEVTFVNRNYKDQLRSFYDLTERNKYYTNEGETTYWGVTLNIRKDFDLGAFGQHIAELTATRSSTKSNYAEWIDPLGSNDLENDSAYVELNGAFVKKEELPVGNFAAPWIVTYTHEMRFWDEKFRLLPTLRYETGGETLLSLGKAITGPDGGKAKRYAIIDRHDTVNVDLSAELELVHYKGNILTLEMDVMNLFDKKNILNSNPKHPSYAMGRQLYLGLKYKF